jgi:hypothetical protein
MSNNEIENEIETIYGGEDAYVEEFKIRPLTIEDGELKLSALMRVGGAEGIYYVRATTTFAEEGGHHVTVHLPAGDLVDELEVDWTTATPEDTMDAVEAMHETYIAAAQDWYGFAVGADAGDGR